MAQKDDDVTEMMTIGRQMMETLRDKDMISTQEFINAQRRIFYSF